MQEKATVDVAGDQTVVMLVAMSVLATAVVLIKVWQFSRTSVGRQGGHPGQPRYGQQRQRRKCRRDTSVEADYGNILPAWLERHKEYPRRAQRGRQQGVALLFNVIDRQGAVPDTGSGTDIVTPGCRD